MWLLAIVASAGALLFGGVTLIVWQSLHPARFPPWKTPSDSGIPFQAVRFSSRDGLTLAGWWVPADSPAATIILCHGYPSDRRDMLPMIPFLHHAGYNLLAFDFRRLGESAGTVCTLGLQEPRDLIGAVDYALKRSNRPIAVLGWSMGAATCIIAAAQDSRIDAIIADSPYRSLEVQATRRFGTGPIARVCGHYAVWLGERIVKESLTDASPLESAKHLGERPLLLIHSRNDRLIAVEDSELIYAAGNGPKAIWVTEASGHVRSYGECTVEYEKRVLRFLGSAVRGPAVRRARKIR